MFLPCVRLRINLQKENIYDVTVDSANIPNLEALIGCKVAFLSFQGPWYSYWGQYISYWKLFGYDRPDQE